MILGIDIGNTAIKFALLKGKRVMKERTIFHLESKKEVRVKIKRALNSFKSPGTKIKDIIICSVVPKHLKLVESQAKQLYKSKPRVIERDIYVPLKNKYKNPKHVGADRLVGAYAAKCLYKEPLIIVDFGTAITFDVINKRGEYEGGIIVPGIRLSAESLFKKTALLPKISTFHVPRSVIGKSTQESILSGLFYGYGALCDGLIDNIKASIGGNPQLILTGGHTLKMKRFLKSHNLLIDKHLVLKGLYLLTVSDDKGS